MAFCHRSSSNEIILYIYQSVLHGQGTYGFLLELISTSGLYLAFAWVAISAVKGQISLGQMTMYLLIFQDLLTRGSFLFCCFFYWLTMGTTTLWWTLEFGEYSCPTTLEVRLKFVACLSKGHDCVRQNACTYACDMLMIRICTVHSCVYVLYMQFIYIYICIEICTCIYIYIFIYTRTNLIYIDGNRPLWCTLCGQCRYSMCLTFFSTINMAYCVGSVDTIFQRRMETTCPHFRSCPPCKHRLDASEIRQDWIHRTGYSLHSLSLSSSL